MYQRFLDGAREDGVEALRLYSVNQCLLQIEKALDTAVARDGHRANNSLGDDEKKALLELLRSPFVVRSP